jgi:hypothetical protein
VSYWSTKSDLEFMERFHADVKALWALEDKYQEAARRRNFRDLSDPPNFEDDPEYQKVREAVARGISRASHIAARLGVPVGLTSYPAPAVGGPIIQTNLFEVILRDTTHRGIPRQDIVDGLNRTVGASEEEVRAERRHVLNPAWWGLQAIAFILRVPLEVAVMMGADRSKLEKEVWPRVLSAVLSAVLIAVLLAWLNLK